MSNSSERASGVGKRSGKVIHQYTKTPEPAQFGYIWHPSHMIKRQMPTYDNGYGIPEMLEEGLRLCPNDKLLNSFARQYWDKGELSPAQYASLKRFYDTWGGNTLP